MKTFRLFSVIMVLALLLSLSAAIPVSAAPANTYLRLDNHTHRQAAIWLTNLKTQQTYILRVESREKGTVEMPRGEYSYFLEACGLSTSGKVQMGAWKVLKLPVCGAAITPAAVDENHQFVLERPNEIRPVRLSVLNDGDESVTVILQHPTRPHYLSIAAHSQKDFSLARLQYGMTILACGKATTMNLDASHPTSLYIPPCNAASFAPRFVEKGFTLDQKGAKLVKVTLTNPFDFDVPVRLKAFQTLGFYLRAGESLTVTIQRGNYQVEYYACNGTLTQVEFKARANAHLTLACTGKVGQ